MKPTTVAAFALAGLFLISACSPNRFIAGSASINSELGSIVCPQSFEVTMDFFSQMVDQQEKQKILVSEASFNEAMATDDKFDTLANSYLKNHLYSLFQEFYQDIKYLSTVEKNSNLQELVSYIKVEDSETSLRKELIEKYKTKINNLSSDLKSMGQECPSDRDMNGEPGGEPKPAPTSDPGALETPRQTVTADLTKSMRKVLAVTYQSCAVLEKKPLEKTDKNVQGIKEECCHESGRGLIRHISSLSLVQSTHPYIQPSYGSQCVNVRKNPLIYDFGGRPNFTRGSTGKLNFFSNWGGSEVLGYDCSAMVYTVLMGAGFRLKENKTFVASDVVAAQSRQFMKPESKGWSCINSVDFTNDTKEPMLPGDVASMDGHVFMIYRVGADPFGINAVTDCKKIDGTNFDFDLMQSSPSKEGVGVNVYVGKDYLPTNETMRKGMVEYAKNYCERVKNGSTKKISLTYFSLVRMSSKTSCRMPTVSFENESCVQQCTN